jgi:hypothetical protein
MIVLAVYASVAIAVSVTAWLCNESEPTGPGELVAFGLLWPVCLPLCIYCKLTDP